MYHASSTTGLSTSFLASRLLLSYLLFHEVLIRPVGRWLARRFNIVRFLFIQASYGSSVRLGANIMIRSPHRIRCATGVTIGDFSELIVEPTGESVSIHLGQNVKIGKRCQISASFGRIVIGDFASIHNNTYLSGEVYIGRYSLLSVNIFASSGDHYPFDTPHLLIRDQDIVALQQAHKLSNGIVIEEDCWIGWGVVIKKGIHIGRGAIIGANSVVTADVAPYTVVAGQPGRPIRERLSFAPPSTIIAAAPEHAPYFYRGFKHGTWEKKGLPITNGLAAMNEAWLALPLGDKITRLRLVGTTLARQVILHIQTDQGIGEEITLPDAAYTPFDITITLQNQVSTLFGSSPTPRLSARGQAISINSLQLRNDRPEYPLWAIHSASRLQE